MRSASDVNFNTFCLLGNLVSLTVVSTIDHLIAFLVTFTYSFLVLFHTTKPRDESQIAALSLVRFQNECKKQPIQHLSFSLLKFFEDSMLLFFNFLRTNLQHFN